MPTKKKKKKGTKYAHNPHYTMIRPSSGEDGVVSTGES